MHIETHPAKPRNQSLFLSTLALLLFVYSCSAETPAKPQATAQPHDAPPVKEPANAATLPRESVSSLDALQRGELPVTADSSPLKDIFFDFDRADLRADARETLKTDADWLKSHPSARVEIEGHCDERGTTEYNLALGAKRAQAALEYLATLGVGSSRLSTVSYGSEVQVCQEHSEDCWQKNRRDRFVTKTGQTN
jgi:peptidoglycan-associated lipoprotein